MNAEAILDADSSNPFTIRLRGKLTAANLHTVVGVVDEALATHEKGSVLVVGSEVTYCDCSGAAVVLDWKRRVTAAGGKLSIEQWPEQFRPLLELFSDETLRERTSHAEDFGIFEEVGRASSQVWKDFKEQLTFLGEVTAAIAYFARRPHELRWKDALLTAEVAGANALPLSMLIGFLIGLIMAFQSGVPMKQFGTEIFVADLVALAMLRELGPLMTTIVLAGRSGSAFAAEIGTMKVSEEISALETMGLDPVRFLVIPRLVAAVFVTPILTIFANLAGLIGGLVVFLSFGFPIVTYFHQVQSAVGLSDLLGGLAKALIFGFLVAATGCLRGLQTKAGASAVGVSTTRAVVSIIMQVAIVDAILSVLYYYLGI